MIQLIFHLFVYHSNDCNSQVWTKLKPGTSNYILVFRMGKGPSAWAVCCCLPRHTSVELDKKQSSWDSMPSLIGSADVTDCHATALVSLLLGLNFMVLVRLAGLSVSLL